MWIHPLISSSLNIYRYDDNMQNTPISNTGGCDGTTDVDQLTPESTTSSIHDPIHHHITSTPTSAQPNKYIINSPILLDTSSNSATNTLNSTDQTSFQSITNASNTIPVSASLPPPQQHINNTVMATQPHNRSIMTYDMVII